MQLPFLPCHGIDFFDVDAAAFDAIAIVFCDVIAIAAVAVIPVASIVFHFKCHRPF